MSLIPTVLGDVHKTQARLPVVDVVAAAPRPPRERQIALAAAIVSIAIVAITLVSVFAEVELSQTSAVSPTHAYSADPFPPLWTTTLPKDSAFGGVINNLAYYTIVPLSPAPNLNFFQFQVVAFSIQNGGILWNSTPISIWGAGNVAPQLVLGPTDLYLVGYASNVTDPGAPWNGTGGVFGIGFDLATGGPGPFVSQLDVAAIQAGQVNVAGGTVYVGYVANGSAVLVAFPLPGDAQGGTAWSYNLKLPADFSSNLVFSVEDGYELVLLPASLDIFNATDGTYLESVPFSYPLDLFDGTVLNGVAYGINWVGPNLFLQGFDLATGSLAVNASLGAVGVPCEPFEVSHVGDVLLASPSCDGVWSAYTPTGTYLWTTRVASTISALSARPIPIGANEVLIYSPLFLSWSPGSPPEGNYSFQGWFTLYNLTTGAVIWQENPWFQVESNLALMNSPLSMSEPPAPTLEAWYSDYVVEWWGGSTGLAAI